MSAPTVTVAMSVYNDAPYVGAAIDSILAQTMADFELLVIDDRSTDGSGEVIAAKAAEDARIRILPSPAKGRVPALNALFAAARAPWVSVQDSDDISTPDRLAKQLDKAASDSRLGVIGCTASLVDADGNHLSDGAPKPIDQTAVLDHLEAKPLVNHNAVLVRRDAVLAIGGYRPAYRHAEDYDLWTRLVDEVHFANLPEDLVAYRVYPGQTSSAHLVEQTTNAAIAWQARIERRAGRADPTDGLAAMPPIGELDALFGRAGVAAYVRRRIVERILYSVEALAGDGYEPVLTHIAETRSRDPRFWRASARLLKSGRTAAAAGLARALLRAG